MYTRSYARAKRYSPPPGYAGSTFVEDVEIKHHPQTDEVIPTPREESAPRETTSQKESRSVQSVDKDKGAIRELLHTLRGRFGSEELVILAVMLLISEDGIGPEVLILALILIAG